MQIDLVPQSNRRFTDGIRLTIGITRAINS